jgi:glycosyltransferase involved in cell wall biosynthesis
MSVHVDDPLWERPRWQWWLRRVDPVIARYICISSRVAEHLAAIVPAAAPRIRRIYYGIELPPTEPDRGEARRRLGLADDAFVAGFVGRLAPQKNLEAITGAAAERPDMQFVLIGDGGERERMDRAAARLPNLRVLGHRPDAAACMHAFDVLCLPSHFEGLGLVLLEAMSRGVLALGSDAGAIPEILDGGRAGVVFDRRNPTGFVAALDWIREHRADAAALALAGRKRVHDTFTTAAMTDATLSVYQEVRAIGEGQN